MIHRLLIVVCLIGILCNATTAAARPISVGVEGRLDIVVKGPELVARPVDDRAVMVVRIASKSREGDFFRYDLRYIANEEGRHDLRDYLIRANGAPVSDLPPLMVVVHSVLPSGHKGELVARKPQRFPFMGGYTLLVVLGVITWAGIPLFLYLRRRNRKRSAPMHEPVTGNSMLGELRVLVQQVLQNSTLSVADKVKLETLLRNYWRQKLELEEFDMSHTLDELKAHPEAGALLHRLEEWLYRPPTGREMNIAAILAPYSAPEPVSQHVASHKDKIVS